MTFDVDLELPAGAGLQQVLEHNLARFGPKADFFARKIADDAGTPKALESVKLFISVDTARRILKSLLTLVGIAAARNDAASAAVLERIEEATRPASPLPKVGVVVSPAAVAFGSIAAVVRYGPERPVTEWQALMRGPLMDRIVGAWAANGRRELDDAQVQAIIESIDFPRPVG
jgi:hypothetical protein